MIARRRAVTLVELLAVLALLGVLAGIAFATYQTTQQSAEETAAETTLRMLDADLRGLAEQTGRLPNDPELLDAVVADADAPAGGDNRPTCFEGDCDTGVIVLTVGDTTAALDVSEFGDPGVVTFEDRGFGEAAGPQVSAAGGDVADVQTGGGDYRIHTFTTTGEFTVDDDAVVDVLLVAGGGGGAGHTSFSSAGGGAGGAGGLVFAEDVELAAGTYTVEVGAGGDGVDDVATIAGSGQDTTAFGFTAIGGGGGILGSGDDDDPAGDGGSGGGGRQEPAGQARQPASPSGGDGHDGARNSDDAGGGGGGGAGEAPADISDADGGGGGDGLCLEAHFGDNVGEGGCFAGGGGGGGDADGAAGPGGIGGGGDGSSARDDIAPQDGEDGTGGGGGGGSSVHPGADGGAGVVIIRYPQP